MKKVHHLPSCNRIFFPGIVLSLDYSSLTESDMTTKRASIPRELTAPSEEFASASESIGLYWWHWNHKEQKVTLSPGLMKILGYATEDFDQKLSSVYKNIHPDDIKRNTERLNRLFHGEIDLYEIEYRVKDSKGEWQWYYNRGTVDQRDEKGNPVGIGGIAIDISGQFKQLLSMVEEKKKFEYIFRNTNEAIVIIELLEGKAGKVLDANKAAMQLFNKGPEVIGKPLPDEILQDDAETELLRESLLKIIGDRKKNV